MEQLNKKKACVLFRSIVEAAEELEPNDALELLLNYAHLGLGDEVDLDKCSKVVRLILKQNIECLVAAERRYHAAVENGKKGAEYGKKGGRPRKGETLEAYKERKKQEVETGIKEVYVAPRDEKREKAKNLSKNYKRTDDKYGRGESTISPSWIKENILSGQKCVYCGESDWHMLGCDRIDNTKPHTPDNVVCSCSKCNIERGRMSYRDFMAKKTEKNSPVKPQNNVPQNSPVKPLEVEVEVYVEKEEEIDKENIINKEDDITMDKYEGFTWEDYLKLFINRNPDFNYNLDNSIFVLTYKDNLLGFQKFITDNTGLEKDKLPIELISQDLCQYKTTGTLSQL